MIIVCMAYLISIGSTPPFHIMTTQSLFRLTYHFFLNVKEAGIRISFSWLISIQRYTYLPEDILCWSNSGLSNWKGKRLSRTYVCRNRGIFLTGPLALVPTNCQRTRPSEGWLYDKVHLYSGSPVVSFSPVHYVLKVCFNIIWHRRIIFYQNRLLTQSVLVHFITSLSETC